LNVTIVTNLKTKKELSMCYCNNNKLTVDRRRTTYKRDPEDGGSKDKGKYSLYMSFRHMEWRYSSTYS
jgi:hypothetical protein